jgi:hypothetical protein
MPNNQGIKNAMEHNLNMTVARGGTRICERVDDKRIMSAISDFLNNQKLVHAGKRIIEISLSDLESTLSAKFYCKLPFDEKKLGSYLNDMIESRNRYTRAAQGKNAVQFRVVSGSEKETVVSSGIRPVFANVVNLKDERINAVNWPVSTRFIHGFLKEELLPEIKEGIATYLVGPIKQSEMHKWGERIPPSVKCLVDVVNEKVISGARNVGWINMFPGQKMNLSKTELKNIILISLGGYATVDGSSGKGKFQIPLLEGVLIYLEDIGKMELTGNKETLWFGLIFSA